MKERGEYGGGGGEAQPSGRDSSVHPLYPSTSLQPTSPPFPHCSSLPSNNKHRTTNFVEASWRETSNKKARGRTIVWPWKGVHANGHMRGRENWSGGC